MAIIITILLFILVLLINVIFHEWGHFFVAKKMGMKVEEFGFGIPPRIYAWKRGETEYSINALPIGGFVKIPGENGEAGDGRGFADKVWYKQAFVLVAGVLANVILAIVLFSVSFMIGTPSLQENGVPTILSVVKDSAADRAGLEVNDTVTSIKNLTMGTLYTDLTTDSLRTIIQRPNTSFEFVYQRDGGEQRVILSPTLTGEVYKMGLSIEKVGVERYGFFESFAKGTKRTVEVIHGIFQALGQLLNQLISPAPSVDGFVGPVGLAKEVRIASSFGLSYFLGFIALISANLAVLNILPFPALDGGRLLIVLLERIVGKKIPAKFVGWLHFAGFALLLLLMLVLTKNDIGL